MAARLITLGALLALLTGAAWAQSLQRLHVTSFVLTSSTAAPAVEQPFSVTLTIHVSERLTHLYNVFLPPFVGPDDLGDERALQSGRNGTTYTETLQLVSHTAGPLTIGSAYLDAIDARTGKPARFLSNGLQLHVGNAAADGSKITLLGFAAAALAGALIAVWLFGRRGSSHVPAPLEDSREDEQPVQPAPAASPLSFALAELRRRRDRFSVLQLRRCLWEELGAREGQTLETVLTIPAAADVRTRALLIAVERAAFIDDARLPLAIEQIPL